MPWITPHEFSILRDRQLPAEFTAPTERLKQVQDTVKRFRVQASKNDRVSNDSLAKIRRDLDEYWAAKWELGKSEHPDYHYYLAAGGDANDVPVKQRYLLNKWEWKDELRNTEVADWALIRVMRVLGLEHKEGSTEEDSAAYKSVKQLFKNCNSAAAFKENEQATALWKKIEEYQKEPEEDDKEEGKGKAKDEQQKESSPGPSRQTEARSSTDSAQAGQASSSAAFKREPYFPTEREDWTNLNISLE